MLESRRFLSHGRGLGVLLGVLTSDPLRLQSAPRPRLASVHRLPLAASDDAALARAAAEGSTEAAAAIWDRFSPLVRGLLRRSLGPLGETEDHVQDVFLRLFEQLGTLRDPSALRSFVVGIALRVARSELRRRRLRRWLFLTETGVTPEPPTAPVDEAAREALARLYATLDRLSDEARLAFVLRHIEGMELAEVAAALGLSLATVKRRLVAANERLHALVRRDPILCEYLVAEPEVARNDEEGSR